MDDMTIAAIGADVKKEEGQGTPNKQERKLYNPSSSVFRSLSRLVIGGLILGFDDLSHTLQSWENKASKVNTMDQAKGDFAKPTEVLINQVLTVPDENETPGNKMRYMAVGLVFETQDRVGAGLKTLGKATRIMGGYVNPILRQFNKSRLFSPMRNHYNKLVIRGQQEVDRWIEIGRMEDAHSRVLAQTALDNTMERSINYLASNEEVQDLVQSQSVSLAGEVVEEVRERTVSADNFMEGMVRALLNRPPRSELPAPPPEILAATQPRQHRKGVQNG